MPLLTVATSVAEELRQFDQAYTSGTLRRSDQERFIQTAKEGFTALVPSLQRAANLIRSFKQVAVDQASDQQRRFDLRTYLDETLLSLTPLLKRTGHLIKLDGCPYGLTMDSYPGALSQIITNLVMNSVLHGFENKANGLIEIAAHVEGKTLILSYHDDGAGLAPAQLAHLYEPFYTTKRQRGGSGLGMHIIHNLVTQKLGGQIDLETAPGKGVAFTLRLPTGQVEPPDSVA